MGVVRRNPPNASWASISPETGGAENKRLLGGILCEKRSFCQDRLGTNRGKKGVEKQRRFLQGMMATRALRATGATTCSVRAWTRRLLFASVCFRLVLNLSWQTEPVLANRRFALWYKRSQQMLLVLQSAAGVLRFINQVRERPTFSTKPRISTTFS